jgi:hypothetical protein
VADDWQQAFAALTAADLPVALSGRTVRVVDSDPNVIGTVLREAGVDAGIEPVPATIDERMLALARA